MSLNRFQFIGNLTRDTEVRHTSNGTAAGVFDVAVTQQWRDNDGNKQEKTNFFRIKTWDKTAENAGKYLGKGSKVYVEGRIENTEYQKDGQTVYGTDFVAEYVQYLDTKGPGGRQGEPE
ncbi:MAG TPA: single-stranded DNA-binding protein [Acidobacteriaceae bacterium]|nr:single-stranded DNA-binding protein [Acidobacteriaceae bacterium]